MTTKEMLFDFNKKEENKDKLYYDDYLIKFANHVAKYYVQQFLKEASVKTECCKEAIVDLGFEIISANIDENSILKLYKPENIK